jgi:hypothetical protein
MIIAGGIVTQKPIGGIVHSNPNATEEEIQAQQQLAAQRQAEQQAQIDAMADKLAQENQNGDKKWSVPFN